MTCGGWESVCHEMIVCRKFSVQLNCMFVVLAMTSMQPVTTEPSQGLASDWTHTHTQMWEYGDYRPIGSRSCLNPGHAPSSNINFAAEVYGKGSRCFEQAGPLERVSSLLDINSETDLFSEAEGKVGGVCYQVGCVCGVVDPL